MRGGTDPGESSSARLYRAALGDGSVQPYLAVFARFDDLGRAGPAWNSAAALFQLGWLVHHRLWVAAAGWGGLAVATGLLVAGLWQLTAGWELGAKLGLSLALVLAALFVSGLWGTAWLHGQLRQRMIAAVDAACEALQAEARERQRRNTWGLAILSAGVLLVGLISWFFPLRSYEAAEAPATVPTVLTTPSSQERVKPEPNFVAEAPDAAVVSALLDEVDQLAAEPMPSPPEVLLIPPVSSASSSNVAANPARVDVVSDAVPPTPTPTPTTEFEARARIKGHGVAVGMFAVEANAQRTDAKLRAAGLPVLSDPVASAKGTITRVRVGPYERPEQAEAAALEVKALGLDAKVYAP